MDVKRCKNCGIPIQDTVFLAFTFLCEGCQATEKYRKNTLNLEKEKLAAQKEANLIQAEGQRQAAIEAEGQRQATEQQTKLLEKQAKKIGKLSSELSQIKTKQERDEAHRARQKQLRDFVFTASSLNEELEKISNQRNKAILSELYFCKVRDSLISMTDEMEEMYDKKEARKVFTQFESDITNLTLNDKNRINKLINNFNKYINEKYEYIYYIDTLQFTKILSIENVDLGIGDIPPKRTFGQNIGSFIGFLFLFGIIGRIVSASNNFPIESTMVGAGILSIIVTAMISSSASSKIDDYKTNKAKKYREYVDIKEKEIDLSEKLIDLRNRNYNSIIFNYHQNLREFFDNKELMNDFNKFNNIISSEGSGIAEFLSFYPDDDTDSYILNLKNEM
jgi:hypothetical protein